MANRVLPSNWGITTPEQLLGNLRVAETGGDIAECADALEWMLRSGRLVDREAIDYEVAIKLARTFRNLEWNHRAVRVVIDAALEEA